MKVCIFGAGAIGTHMAARLGKLATSIPTLELAVVARGAQADALGWHGARVTGNGDDIHGWPHQVTSDAATLQPQDIVFVTLKGPALPPLAATLDRLTARDGVVVFVQNGIPWWWNIGRSEAKSPLPLLDPDGELMRRFATRALGCVVSSANELRSPGVAFNATGRNLAFGEPDGSTTSRLEMVRELMEKAGFMARASADLRADIWTKLAYNIAANPISALTGQVLGDWLAKPEWHRLAIGMAGDLIAIARGLGWDFGETLSAESVFGVPGSPKSTGTTIRSSMLQDLERGRPLEIDPILAQPVAFADELGLLAPHLRQALAQLRALEVKSRAAA